MYGFLFFSFLLMKGKGPVHDESGIYCYNFNIVMKPNQNAVPPCMISVVMVRLFALASKTFPGLQLKPRYHKVSLGLIKR
jgi:hypothetical protein